jgi:quercetin dioxygenase-like cupin family protein
MELVRWRDITPQEVTQEGATNTTIRILIGPDNGAPNFIMRLFEIAPGGATPAHSHDFEHEIFVLSGSGVCIQDEKVTPVGPEEAIFMPGGEKHCFRNTGDQALRIICLIPRPDARH